jgi:hypothetical protein
MHKIFISLLIIYSFVGQGLAQLYAPQRDAAKAVEYTSEYHTDSIYIFNLPNPGEAISAGLTAIAASDTCSWDYEWAVFNGAYSIFKTDTGSTSTVDTITVPGYYRVRMISDCEDTLIYAAWVVFNDFRVSISKEPNGIDIFRGDYNCQQLWIKSTYSADSLYYTKPETDSTFILYGDIEDIDWTTIPDSSAIKPPPTLSPLMSNPPSSPPAYDVWYTLLVTDEFGLTRKDSAFYETIQTKALFSVEPIKLSDTTYYDNPKNYEEYYYGKDYHSLDDYKNSAPLTVEVHNNSLNGSFFEWDFDDGADSITYDDAKELAHLYVVPRINSYYIKLRSHSEEGCEHLDSVEVIVNESKISLETETETETDNQQPNDQLKSGIPNVFFAIEGNSFRFYDASIYEIKVKIFNRYGKVVHTYEGYVRNWPGWDFKVHGNNLAAEGIYYYVIEVQRYNVEKEKFTRNKKKPYNGYFYLFHPR